jgi:endonuclease YncB( thermonuclease family)
MGNCYLKQQLENCTIDNTPKYSYKGKTKFCKVIKVYDGDTITVALKLEKKIFASSVRMFGYDSPEMKPLLSQKNRDKEIKAAKKAKQAISDKILGKIVKIEILGFDKYGRILGNIYNLQPDGCFGIYSQYTENINQYMLDNKYGYQYKGGTKKKFESKENH